MNGVLARSHRICRFSSTRFLQTIVGRRYLHSEQVLEDSTSLDIIDLNVKAATAPPYRRFLDFPDFYEFVKGGVGSKRAVPSRGIRNSSWKILFQLAKTAEQLEQVVELLPKWREMQRSFDMKDSEIFVRRCEELQCPGLALQVFGNHPKYGFDLSSYTAALQLLHSLHLSHPLEDTITASALFSVYKHPPVSSSLPACTMLVSACLKHRTDDRAQAVADALLRTLKKLCSDTPASGARDPIDPKTRALFREKPKVWMRAALKKIERILKKEGKEYGWVSDAIRKFRPSIVE